MHRDTSTLTVMALLLPPGPHPGCFLHCNTPLAIYQVFSLRPELFLPARRLFFRKVLPFPEDFVAALAFTFSPVYGILIEIM